MSDCTVFIGRQPILNRLGNIFAYELLYRNSEVNSFPNVSPETATIGLLVNTFLTVGIDQVTCGVPSFINFTDQLLEQDLFMELDPDQVIIEILEDVEMTAALLDRLRLFKEEGFQLAMDDFTLKENYLAHRELFDLVDIVKVDFRSTTKAEHQRIRQFLKDYPSITLLAEKIETEAEYRVALQSGYHLFQGYFFAEPEIIKSAEIPSNTMVHLQLIDQFRRDTPSIQQLADLIQRDVSISYKLLRFINSLAFDMPKRISSIKQAIVLIGLDEMEKWLQVLMLHDLGVHHADNGRIQALIELSLKRAKLCELLAKEKRKTNSDEYFLAGMFSLMDAVMRRKWEDLLPLLSLSELIIETLQGNETEIAPYLRLVIALERFDWEAVDSLAEQLQISPKRLSELNIAAHVWVQEVNQTRK